MIYFLFKDWKNWRMILFLKWSVKKKWRRRKRKGEVIVRYVTAREGKRKSRMAVLFETTVVCMVVNFDPVENG
jgi:hypothetical protein